MSNQIIVYPFSKMVLNEREIISELVDKGLEYNPDQKSALVGLLFRARSLNLPEKYLLQKPGYVNNHIILPSGDIIGPDPEGFVLLNQPNPDDWKAGSLSECKNTFRKIWLEGNNLMRFAILVAGAGLVTSFLGTDGVIFAATGSSSLGKSTALRIAASFNGNPNGDDGSSLFKLRATENGMEGTLQQCSGVTWSLDETSLFEGNLQRLLFMIAEGKGKARATQQGEARPVKSFKGVAFMSSETGIRDLVKQAGNRVLNGMSVRAFDIDVSNIEPVSDEVYNEIERGISSNYGHASKVFAKELLQTSRGTLEDWVMEVADTIAEETSDGVPTTYLQRAAFRFAILEIAGELMLDCELIPNEGIDLTEVVDWALHNSIGDPNRNFGDPVQNAINLLRETVIAKLDREIASLDIQVAQNYRDPKAYFSDKNNRLYIPGDILLEWSGGTEKLRTLVTELRRQDFLDSRGPKDRTYSTIPGKGKIRHYRIDLAKFRGSTKDSDK